MLPDWHPIERELTNSINFEDGNFQLNFEGIDLGRSISTLSKWCLMIITDTFFIIGFVKIRISIPEINQRLTFMNEFFDLKKE